MKNQKSFYMAVFLLVLFAVWTGWVCCVDVQPIGPKGADVGFATLNGWVHSLIGVNMTLYTITDWLGILPIAIAGGFGIYGFIQWIKRKKLWQVDRSILILGCFYIAVIAVYIFFEWVPVNERPVLIENRLEASYPSSTTMLTLCVMITALMQWNARIQNEKRKRCVMLLGVVFIVFMLLGRLLSGVHWVTDIIGGCLISAGLVLLYQWAVDTQK